MIKTKERSGADLGLCAGPGIFFRTLRPNEDIFTSDMQVGGFDEMRLEETSPFFTP